MFSAVSYLSPVSIQKLIPALSRSLIVSGTSSCKASSTAVHPSKYKSFSIKAATSARLSSLFSISVAALSYCSFHFLKSFLLIYLKAISKTLNPLDEN